MRRVSTLLGGTWWHGRIHSWRARTVVSLYWCRHVLTVTVHHGWMVSRRRRRRWMHTIANRSTGWSRLHHAVDSIQLVASGKRSNTSNFQSKCTRTLGSRRSPTATAATTTRWWWWNILLGPQFPRFWLSRRIHVMSLVWVVIVVVAASDCHCFFCRLLQDKRRLGGHDGIVQLHVKGGRHEFRQWGSFRLATIGRWGILQIQKGRIGGIVGQQGRVF